MPAGRPSKYRPEYIEQAFKLTLLGLDDQGIAKALGVHIATLCQWKNKYPRFREAIKSGKERADSEIVNAMYERARGMTVREVRVDPDGNETVTDKQLPPDNASAIFWLKNRQAAHWRDRREQVVEVKRVEEMDTKELDVYASELDRQLNELDGNVTAH